MPEERRQVDGHIKAWLGAMLMPVLITLVLSLGTWVSRMSVKSNGQDITITQLKEELEKLGGRTLDRFTRQDGDGLDERIRELEKTVAALISPYRVQRMEEE